MALAMAASGHSLPQTGCCMLSSACMSGLSWEWSQNDSLGHCFWHRCSQGLYLPKPAGYSMAQWPHHMLLCIRCNIFFCDAINRQAAGQRQPGDHSFKCCAQLGAHVPVGCIWSCKGIKAVEFLAISVNKYKSLQSSIPSR